MQTRENVKRNAKRYMKRLHTLEEELQNFIKDACEYQDNTFHSHPEYYIEYFEIRLEQLGILHNLRQKIKKDTPYARFYTISLWI